MPKRKTLFVCFGCLALICIASILFFNGKTVNGKEINAIEKEEEKENLSNDKIDESFSEDDTTTIVNNEISEEENQVNDSSVKNNIEKNDTTSKKETSVNSTQESFSNKEATTIEEENSSTPVQEQENPKQNNIWDKLGMSEYQYYNEPMYKWEHVDFSITNYSTESAARNACLEYGDKYEPYLNGEVLYHCTTVNTASGKYLGEMFHTEKLIN